MAVLRLPDVIEDYTLLSVYCSAHSDLFKGCASKHVSLWRSVCGSPRSYLGCFSWDSMCSVLWRMFPDSHTDSQITVPTDLYHDTTFVAGVFSPHYISVQISRSTWIWGLFSNAHGCNKTHPVMICLVFFRFIRQLPVTTTTRIMQVSRLRKPAASTLAPSTCKVCEVFTEEQYRLEMFGGNRNASLNLKQYIL